MQKTLLIQGQINALGHMPTSKYMSRLELQQQWQSWEFSKLHSNIMERLQARREMMESDHGGQVDDEVSSYEFSLT